MGRRPKINRRIGTPSEGEIVRLDVYRRDDAGTEFKTSMSLDPATMELALAIHGNTKTASHWLTTRAEELWEEDRDARLSARARGIEHRGASSISRDVAREVIEAATTRLLQGTAAAQAAPGHGPIPKAKRKPKGTASSAQGDRMTGALVEVDLLPDGRLTGRVLTGPQEGHDLRDLALADLLALLADAGDLDDKTDEALVMAFLNHRHPGWRNSVDEGTDELREDREFLGLPKGADAAQIKLAHRRLLAKVHPDHGGTNALAARLNMAKDRLLAALAASKTAAE